MTLRVAMWSGPRNISTAMMRAWGNRPDTAVCDEPLYAHYLAVTGTDHPGAAEIVARGETDWRAVVRFLAGPAPDGAAIFYQKHMAHHLLAEIDRDWVWRCANVFLIRDPREMLLSLRRVMPAPAVADTGLPQQVELFDELRGRTGETPPVLDARDVLEDPRALLEALCARLGIEFLPAMLSWPSGPRATDGPWADHWYASVRRSTGFEPWRPRTGELPVELAPVLEACLPYYRHLFEHRLTA